MTHEPPNSVDTKNAKEELAELLNRVLHNNERIILTRRGKEIAAIIPLADLARLQASENKNDLEKALEALKEAREKGTISLDDFKEK